MATALAPEERATLEAALAFIDECYDGADDATASRNAAAATRARNNAAAARTNRQKRVELLRLRELADELEATRDALAATAPTSGRPPNKRARGSGQDAGSLARRTACLARAAAAVAAREALRLHESRARNRRLRAALDEQREVSAALVRVLSKRLDQKSVRELLAESSEQPASTVSVTAPLSPRWPWDEDASPLDRRSLCSDLRECLRAFVEEANAALALRSRERVLAESRTRAFRHPALGPIVAMVSSTLVPCDLDDAWSHMMHSFRNEIATANGHTLGYRFQSRPTTEPGVSEKEYAMEFPPRNPQTGGRVPVHGVALFETLTASDWRVFIWTAVVATRGDGTQVRERGWTAMARTTAGHSVLHMRYEVYVGSSQLTQAQTSTRPQQLRAEKEKFLAEALLRKARQDQIQVENALAARFGLDASCVASLFA